MTLNEPIFSNNNEAISSSEVLLNMIFAFTDSQVIFVAAKLGIADLISNGYQTCDELAKVTGINSKFIYHLMQMLVSLGVFGIDENGRFNLTSIGTHLQTDTTDSLRSTAISLGSRSRNQS